MITPKIRSFAKLIALLGNDRKEEETSSGMSIHRSIDQSKDRQASRPVQQLQIFVWLGRQV